MSKELSYEIDVVTLTNMGPKLIHDLTQVAPAYAKAKADYESLDESKKTLLAFLSGKQEGSESAKNRQALCSKEYKEHLKALDEARLTYLTQQVLYEIQRKRLDVWQTMMASRREELKKGV